MKRAAALTLVVASWLAACAAPTSTEAPTASRPSLLPPIVHPAENPGSAAKIALGAQLFVDPRLSGSGTMACQSCHYRQLGWTDGTPVSKRDDGQINTRHSPTLYNVGYQTAWYWDGRATTLDGQILAAWRNQTGADPAKVAEKLAAVPGYATQFQAIYATPPTPDAIVKSLAAYLRTKVSADSPWDRYEAGDRRAVSADAVAGYDLFVGKGRCVVCHSPPFYGNSTFWNIGIEAGKARPDVGRSNVSKADADTSAFKTPTLRSVAQRAPFFHDGSGKTLVDAVRLMASGGGADPKKTPILVDTALSDAEVGKVVAFLESLTSTEPWQAPAVP